MIYLKEFATQAAYESAESSLLRPNVALIAANGEIKYKGGSSPVPPTPTHEYVDLGLPSGALWATMNLGASSITDVGLYYQWGDTQGYEHGHEPNYKWYDSENNRFTKYNYSDGKMVLDNEDDAVIASWGDGWHIPTKAQYQELIDNTTFNWEIINGVKGGKFTAQNDKYIFLPINIDYGTEFEKLSYQTNECINWGTTLDSDYDTIYDLYVIGDYPPEIRDKEAYENRRRADGISIRPVKDA